MSSKRRQSTALADVERSVTTSGSPLAVRLVKRCVVAAALAIGCAGAQEPPAPEPPIVDDEGIMDTYDDTCHLLQECWDLDEFADTSGCPTEPEIEFPAGSSELPGAEERGLSEIVAEVRELGGRLRLLRLAGYASEAEPSALALARAEAVRDRLVALGVSPDILETTGEQDGDRRYVVIVVVDCDPIVSR